MPANSAKAFDAASFDPASFGGIHQRGFLQVAVGFQTGYEVGDIHSATNWRRVRHLAAEDICHPRSRPWTVGAFMDSTHVAHDYDLKTHEYKFERLNTTQCKLVRLSDMSEIIIDSNVPYVHWDGRTYHMDVGLTFAQAIATMRKKDPQGNYTAQGKWVYGTSPMSCWFYGGKQTHSHAVLDDVWTQIETKTPHLESNVTTQVFSNYRKYLTIAVNDFTDAESGELQSSLVDLTDPDNPITVKERKYKVTDYTTLRDVVQADVQNPSKPLFLHEIRKHVRQNILTLKTLP